MLPPKRKKKGVGNGDSLGKTLLVFQYLAFPTPGGPGWLSSSVLPPTPSSSCSSPDNICPFPSGSKQAGAPLPAAGRSCGGGPSTVPPIPGGISSQGDAERAGQLYFVPKTRQRWDVDPNHPLEGCREPFGEISCFRAEISE